MCNIINWIPVAIILFADLKIAPNAVEVAGIAPITIVVVFATAVMFEIVIVDVYAVIEKLVKVRSMVLVMVVL